MEQSLRLRYQNESLALSIHRPDQYGLTKCPVVVICHGFVGSRIGVDRLFVNAGRLFQQHGFMVLRFDYVGCGESTGDYGSTGLASMIAQTRVVLDYVFSLAEVDSSRVTLLGHSLGGAAAMMAATQDTRIQKLVLWSPVAHPFEEITRIVGSRVTQMAEQGREASYLGYHLTSEFFKSLRQCSPLANAQRFRGRVLIVHGLDDGEIPAENSTLYQNAFQVHSESCVLRLIEGANHTYSNGQTSRMVRAMTLDWLKTVHNKPRIWHVS